ncbi:uncharacterized protein LOC129757009 [Uranotaenia lowii]|uniref:uncharacterized protein LOC129757009 n=1 Tax=Uranotaenia lowii TaxID=190385 RepID=UPI00247A4EDC|nr:uncharacterized protein LOC129757009 [Uranotaenia lowii]
MCPRVLLWHQQHPLQLISCHWMRRRKLKVCHLLATWVVFSSFLLQLSVHHASAKCHSRVPRACEAICINSETTTATTSSSSDGHGHEWKCELRIIVIMPSNTSIEASYPRVHPVLLKSEEYIRSQQIIPPSVAIRWIHYDDKCDQARATVSAMDGTGLECGHVILGPTCDLALAPVARIGRFINNAGVPVITGAGYTFDFVQRKTLCEDEFFMLIRTGSLSFKRIAFFMIDLLR